LAFIEADGEMGQGAALQVGNDLLDDGVVMVLGLGGRCGRGREHPVVPVRREQLTLPGGGAGRVESFDAAHDQPSLDPVLGAGRFERGAGGLGDLRVGDPPLLLFIEDRGRELIEIHAVLGIVAIALVTARSIRAVTANWARPRRTAATTLWV
jgi:hypothetical protein